MRIFTDVVHAGKTAAGADGTAMTVPIHPSVAHVYDRAEDLEPVSVVPREERRGEHQPLRLVAGAARAQDPRVADAAAMGECGADRPVAARRPADCHGSLPRPARPSAAWSRGPSLPRAWVWCGPELRDRGRRPGRVFRFLDTLELITSAPTVYSTIAASFGVRAKHTWVGAKCPPAVALRGWERARSYGYSGQLPASN